MGEYALIEYIFVFSPRDTWASIVEFEIAMEKFLGENGMEMQVVKNVEGGNSRRMLLISKREPDEALQNFVPEKPQTFEQKIKTEVKVQNEKV